jgi:hypothetical protein
VLIRIEKESFVLKDGKTGKEKEIAYADVAKLEAPAHSLGVKTARQTLFVAIAPVVAIPIMIRDLCE